ncbi:MAG: holo-ACP synthase [Solirubrobacteraceae bacterium]|nr:holo-ACP synthase [Solirubrobacteraceae bacterium]
MTVVGIGIDVVDVPSFAAQLADHASGFVAGTFTAGEIRAAADHGGAGDATADSRPREHAARRDARLAARFAAKEAFVKAWSASRRGRPPALGAVDLRWIEVVDDGFGRPGLRLHGPVADALRDLGDPAVHLTMSHDGPVATAMVVLDREPPAAPSSPRADVPGMQRRPPKR